MYWTAIPASSGHFRPSSCGSSGYPVWGEGSEERQREEGDFVVVLVPGEVNGTCRACVCQGELGVNRDGITLPGCCWANGQLPDQISSPPRCAKLFLNYTRMHPLIPSTKRNE